MFEGWDNFYLLIGGAAGALIGLMFVVITLTGNIDREQSLRAAAIYMTPTVTGFTIVLVLSALTGVRGLPANALAAMLGAIAIAGGLNSILNCWRLMGRGPPNAAHWTDHWCYGLAPLIVYVAFGGAALAIGAHRSWAADALAAVMVVQLLLSIRNAWDLVTWLAPSARAPKSD